MIILTVSEFRKTTKESLDKARDQPIFINRNGHLFKVAYETDIANLIDRKYGEPVEVKEESTDD